MTGGSFGPEGGLASTIAMASVLVLLVRRVSASTKVGTR